MLAEAARHNVANGAQIIDINMGCPAKKVCNVAAGSALLQNEALVAQIFQRTGGVPLLVEEFTRLIRDSVAFKRAHEQEIPATLQQLVLARLDRMGSNRAVVHLAVTLGPRFPHDILAAVAALPRDVTVLLIEHDMDLVFSFADRISVLVGGALLVEGPPDEVARDPQVKAVYLGEGADA